MPEYLRTLARDAVACFDVESPREAAAAVLALLRRHPALLVVLSTLLLVVPGAGGFVVELLALSLAAALAYTVLARLAGRLGRLVPDALRRWPHIDV